MKKAYIYFQSLILACAILSVSACSDDFFNSTDGEEVAVNFHPTLGGRLKARAIGNPINTRAIGDATGIDRLVVAVFEGNKKVLSQTYAWSSVQSNGVSLTLIEGHSYNILFWAENSLNKAYTLSDDGTISVDYDEYLDGGFSQMEELDAFYATTSLTVGSQKVENKGEIQLTRPLAQINFADNTTQPVNGFHRAVVTYQKVPTKFNPFTGSIAGEANNLTFTFSDFPSNENLSFDGSTYYYVSCNYLFAPATGVGSVEASLDMQNAQGTSLKTVELSDIPIEQNKRTNILGNIVIGPETWSVWDGTIPDTSPITVDDQNRYIIDEANDIAWLGVNAGSLEPNRTFLITKDIDMNKLPGLSAINLPSGSTLQGGGHTIKGIISDSGLLGVATNLTVKDLIIDDVTVINTSADVTHVGTLLNILKGNGTFSGIEISNSSVSTQNGAAGGIVGYISRSDANNRSETLAATFDDCHVSNTNADGSRSEGHFVGLLRGYDLNETLSFDSNCTLSDAQTLSWVSPYREGNEGVWLASTDYSYFNQWLGDEECYRGTVMYGANRFIPCWDGSTKITPLYDGSTKLIYSPFDLAFLQGSSAGDIELMENVCMEYDLDGASRDGVRNHNFTALNTLNSLEGNGHTIYNLTITGNYYCGFVYSEGCATTFKNVNFDGTDIRVTHGSEGDAYVGTLRGMAYANTIIENVHVRNGYLYGVNKMGGLCGGIFSTITCSNSSVENYQFENYDSEIVSGGFKANGEIGGLIGFIIVTDATWVDQISNCSVKNNSFNCVTYSASFWDRSVGRFIGDIRTSKAGRVNINNCSIDGSHSYTNAETGASASFDEFKVRTGGSFLRPVYTYYPLVGQCYAVVILDTKGTVYIDDTKIFG